MSNPYYDYKCAKCKKDFNSSFEYVQALKYVRSERRITSEEAARWNQPVDSVQGFLELKAFCSECDGAVRSQ